MMEAAICEHCGMPITRSKQGDEWRHYPTLKAEFDQRPVAKPRKGSELTKAA